MPSEDRDDLEPKVRVIQIILMALAMGAVMFGAIVIVLQATGPPAAEDAEPSMPLISYMAVGFGVMGLIMSMVLPGMIASQSPPTVQTYQTGKIISGALLEGPAFFNLIAYMLEQQIYSLAVAAIMVVFILMQIPTVDGVREWLNQHERLSRDSESFNR